MDYTYDKEKYKNVRIYSLDQKRRPHEEKTLVVHIDKSNVEDSLNAIEELGYEHIHIQTFNIDFLDDRRLKHLKGITIQHYVEDFTPFYRFNLKQLTHLGLQERVSSELDFALFPNLICLKGRLPEHYQNINMLNQIKYISVFGYRKEDFNELKSLTTLKKVWIDSTNLTTLNGISNLINLQELGLHTCPKLMNLDGLTESNDKLKIVSISNCKKLSNISKLEKLKNLKSLHLHLNNLYKIDSLNFLENLNSLENLSMHPDHLNVAQDDYYPLIKKLKELDQLSNLKYWDKLEDYLNNQVIIKDIKDEKLSEIQLLLKKSPILTWIRDENDDFYWDIYSAENCHKAQQILIDLATILESDKDLKEEKKVALFGESIIKLNKHNEDSGRGFIETVERDELCEFYDNLADAAGIDVMKYNNSITDEWRAW